LYPEQAEESWLVHDTLLEVLLVGRGIAIETKSGL